MTFDPPTGFYKNVLRMAFWKKRRGPGVYNVSYVKTSDGTLTLIATYTYGEEVASRSCDLDGFKIPLKPKE